MPPNPSIHDFGQYTAGGAKWYAAREEIKMDSALVVYSPVATKPRTTPLTLTAKSASNRPAHDLQKCNYKTDQVFRTLRTTCACRAHPLYVRYYVLVQISHLGSQKHYLDS